MVFPRLHCCSLMVVVAVFFNEVLSDKEKKKVLSILIFFGIKNVLKFFVLTHFLLSPKCIEIDRRIVVSRGSPQIL